MPLADAGYRIIVPDYRGCGQSSHPTSSANAFTKSTMADDLANLIHEHLAIKPKIHIVGHDIGGMIAHAYASRHPELVSSIILGECPLPGTHAYASSKAMPTVQR
jgi:pimeloyl-ACP methyl ester carboxylesterase